MTNNSLQAESKNKRPQSRYSFPASTTDTTMSENVTLVCKDKEFQFPRNLLSKGSPVFQAMFGSGFEEAKTGRANLESIESGIMNTILTFIATRSIPEELHQKDVGYWCHLLEASHLLQMSDLSHYCQRQMCGVINSDDFLAPWTLANLYDYAGFGYMIRTFVANNFDDVSQSEDFVLLDIDMLKEVIVHPELVVCSMDGLVAALFNWVESDSEHRTIHLLELLDLVDLSSLSNKYLNNLICHRLVKRSHRIRSRLYSAASGLRHSKSVCLKPNSKRTSTKLYCFGSKREMHILSTYDLESHQWLPVQEIPFSVTAGMATTFIGNRIYLAGGCDQDDPDKISSKMYVYYPDAKTYSETRLLFSVSHAGAGVLHGCVYLVNGDDEKSKPLNTVQLYDPVKDICKRVVSTKQSHVRPFVGAYEDYLYVIGSCNDSQKDLERYDSFICQWTTIATTPGTIDWCHATLCRHELFVVRSVCEDVFHVYNLKQQQWSEQEFGEPSPNRVWGLWSEYSKNENRYKIIVRDRSHVLQFYDVATEMWDECSRPNENLWYGPQTVIANS